MATWDDVDLDFGLDETVNFGPRIESGISLYQLNTDATVSSRGGFSLDCVPIVSACTGGEAVFLASNQQLTVFAEGGHKFVATLSFQSNVVAVCCTDDGMCFVVGEQFGEVHIFRTSTCAKLFSKFLASPSASKQIAEESIPTFIRLSFDNQGTSLTVLTGSGLVHRIGGLDPGAMCSADNVTDSRLLLSRITATAFNARDVHQVSVRWMTALPSSNTQEMVVTSGAGDANLCVWKRKDGAFMPRRLAEHPCNDGVRFALTKICATPCGKFICASDTSGGFSLWSAQRLTIMKIGSATGITDFIVVGTAAAESSDMSAMGDLKVLMVTKMDAEATVQICTLPCLESLYTVSLLPFVTLASCPTSQDDLYIVEGTGDSPTDPPSTLRLRSLTETQPEARLLKLLNKRLYAEAEEFCRVFRLEPTVVLKSKVVALLDRLSSSEERGSTADELGDVLSALKTSLVAITDAKYVAECCISATPPDLGSTLDLLTLARERLLADGLEGCPEMTRVLDASHRLATFQMTFGGDVFIGSVWERFRNGSMYQQFVGCLSEGRIQAAAMIWTRHHSEFGEKKKKINVKQLEEWFDCIPERSSSAELRVSD